MVDVAAVVVAACRRAVSEVSPIPGGDICRAWRVAFDDGRIAFAKTLAGVPDIFDAEARSLAWLADGGAPVPAVLGVRDDMLALDWLPAGAPSVAAAARLGRDLAAVHASGADRFGAPWPGFAGRLRVRSEERRVGKECRSRWSRYHEEKKVSSATLTKMRRCLCRHVARSNSRSVGE